MATSTVPTRDENTRLIEEEVLEQTTLPTSSTTADVPTPLNWRPILVLLVLNGMQPLIFEVIFPFVNQMILEIGVVTDPERVGFYSGLIESIYSCMSFIAILPFSALTDHIGRKPVILGGMLGLAVSAVCFGMSKSFMAMVVSRCLGGTLGAVWACTRIVLAEMTDRSNQGVAFSALTIAFRTGQIIGLPLGGLLAHPERNFPLFRTPFWYEYPFALPCFVAASLCVCAVTMGYFFLSETLRSKQKHASPETTYGAIGSPGDGESRSPPISAPEADFHPPEDTIKHTYKSVLTPSIISFLCSNLAMCLASETLFSVFPLFSFTPVASGGLGMSEAAIGTQMGIRAFLHVGIQGFFSPLQRRFGSVRVYQLAMATWPVLTLCFPLLNLMARRGDASEWPFLVAFVIFFIVWSIGGFGWTAIAILVNDSAPSESALATLNGVSQMVMVFPQVVAPAFVSSLFAASIKSGIADGNLIWITLFVLTCAAAMHSLTLREPDTDWR